MSMSAVDVHSLACRFVGALCRGCLKGLLAGACVGSSLFSCGMVTFNEQNMLLSRCQNLQTWPSWSVFWLCRCLLYLEAVEMFSVCRPVACSCWFVGSVGGRVGITVIFAHGLSGNAAHLYTGSACGGSVSVSCYVSTVLQLFKTVALIF